MAVPAVEAHAADVMRVTELDWLLDEIVLGCVVAGKVQGCHDPAEKPQALEAVGVGNRVANRPLPSRIIM
jgi:hypothetical protein